MLEEVVNGVKEWKDSDPARLGKECTEANEAKVVKNEEAKERMMAEKTEEKRGTASCL